MCAGRKQRLQWLGQAWRGCGRGWVVLLQADSLACSKALSRHCRSALELVNACVCVLLRIDQRREEATTVIHLWKTRARHPRPCSRTQYFPPNEDCFAPGQERTNCITARIGEWSRASQGPRVVVLLHSM